MNLRILIVAGLLVAGGVAQTSSDTTSSNQQKLPPVKQTVEVTATRIPEDPAKVPAPIQVFTGDELSARGATNLRSALGLATGVEIASGGDAGPASDVPDFWGLKEFDAFLLVVDGTPWGGTFNPALTTLSLDDVDRIEVLRGPAAVTYGATSFVGVIHVIHKAVDAPGRSLELHAGSYGSGGAAFSTPIPLPGDWASRLTVDGERLGFSDDRTSWRRGHGLWRIGQKSSATNRVWFNADVNWLDQDPASPRPRDGVVFSPLVPVDANLNPAGAFLNDHRFTFMGGFDRNAAGGRWGTSATVSHARQNIFRGFVQALEDAPDNAHGVREQIHLTDFYLDSHLSWKLPGGVVFLAGADYLHGTGNARGADFDYDVLLNGSSASVVPSPADLDFRIGDHRNFVGPYAALQWSPLERVHLGAGIRLNITRESQTVIDGGAGTSESDVRTNTRAGGTLGLLVDAWRHDEDSVGLYVNYRDTYKPAAIDFGIGEEEEGGGGGRLILAPETSRSVDGGLKARFLQRRVEAEVSGFFMDFTNLVTATSVNGVPALINSGNQHFRGLESSIAFFLRNDVMARATYSLHDARFTDFVQDFDGVPTQLAGNRLEMSARNLASVGITYAPPKGIIAGFTVNATSNRFLDKRNRALSPGFATLNLTAGYRTRRWELRATGENLTNARDPVSESELGDAQYYLMPARRADVRLRFFF